MRKPVQIRITANDQAEYARLARNTKAKIRRTFKNYGIDLSSEISVPKLEDFDTRKEFNAFKKKAESFTNRNNLNYQFIKNEHGIVATKKEIQQITRDTNKAIRLAKAKIKEMESKPFIQGGKTRGTLQERAIALGERNVTGIGVPIKFDFNNIKSYPRLEEVKTNMENRSKGIYYKQRNKTLQDNFLKALAGSFNSEADDIIEEIKKINPDDFFEIWAIYNADFEFSLYDSDGQVVSANTKTLDEIRNALSDYREGRINLDMKDF